MEAMEMEMTVGTHNLLVHSSALRKILEATQDNSVYDVGSLATHHSMTAVSVSTTSTRRSPRASDPPTVV